MKTKQDLLNRMSALAACYEATVWVTSQEGTALEIGLRSDRIDWLVWLIGRIDPVAIADFARRCTDRAKGYANASSSAYANAAEADAYAAYAANAAAYAAHAAHAAYDAAAYAAAAADASARCAAAYGADAADAERQAQLTDLRVMWVGVCT